MRLTVAPIEELSSIISMSHFSFLLFLLGKSLAIIEFRWESDFLQKNLQNDKSYISIMAHNVTFLIKKCILVVSLTIRKHFLQGLIKKNIVFELTLVSHPVKKFLPIRPWSVTKNAVCGLMRLSNMQLQFSSVSNIITNFTLGWLK